MSGLIFLILGFLNLESEIEENENMDPFMKKGLQLVVDGVHPDYIRNMLEIESEMSFKRHKTYASMFESAAFLATLYGLGSANLIFLPIATRLKNLAKDEQLQKEIIIEALSLVQEKVSSTNLTDTLKSFLDRKDQAKLDSRYLENLNKEGADVA